MKEIISRWSKKSLSQIFDILAGIILVIEGINYFTVAEIKLNFLDIISVNNINFKTTIFMWIFSILIFSSVIFQVVRYFLRKYVPADVINDEEKYAHVLVYLYTFEDILDLIASTYALVIMVIIYQIYNESGIFIKTSWAIVTYFGVALRFYKSIYCHFYFENCDIFNQRSSNF